MKEIYFVQLSITMDEVVALTKRQAVNGRMKLAGYSLVSMVTVMRRTSSRAIVAVVVAVVCAVLTSCSADSSDASGSRSSAAGGTSTPSRAAIPSPSPTGPCAGGTCQIDVAVGQVVVLPERYGLGPIEVTAITVATVEMVAPLTGSGYSVSGCSGGGSVSSQGGGGVRLSCKVGTVATINDVMSLEVVEIRATIAVLRIKPAG